MSCWSHCRHQIFMNCIYLISKYCYLGTCLKSRTIKLLTCGFSSIVCAEGVSVTPPLGGRANPTMPLSLLPKIFPINVVTGIATFLCYYSYRCPFISWRCFANLNFSRIIIISPPPLLHHLSTPTAASSPSFLFQTPPRQVRNYNWLPFTNVILNLPPFYQLLRMMGRFCFFSPAAYFPSHKHSL